MGLMDKVKAQASSLAQQANAGIAKLDAMPGNRRADTLLRSLGVAILAERTGRATPATSGEIERLLADLAQHEAQNNVNLVEQAAQAQAQQAAMAARPGEYLTSSDPGLDPNMSATMPGGAAGYGGAPGYDAQTFPAQGQTGFPGAAPTSFPDPAPATSFPGAAPTSFPEAAPATSFPAAAPATFFPEAAPVQEAAEDSAPEQAAPGFPDPGPATSFPPTSGA